MWRVSLKYGMKASFACSTVDARAVTAFSFTREIPFYVRVSNFWDRCCSSGCVRVPVRPSMKFVIAAQA